MESTESVRLSWANPQTDTLKVVFSYFPAQYRAVVLGRVCHAWRRRVEITDDEIRGAKLLGNFRAEICCFLEGNLAGLDRWAKHVMGMKRTAPLELEGKQGTPEWLAMRRTITASSAASKCGIGAYCLAHDELYALKAGIRLNETEDMRDGHLYEDDVAHRGLELIFPGELFTEYKAVWKRRAMDDFNRASNAARDRLRQRESDPSKKNWFDEDSADVEWTISWRYRRTRPLFEVCIWVMRVHYTWLSASPDRCIAMHPHATETRNVLLEVKYSNKILYTRPKVEYLVQCVLQMYHADSDWMFLVYGFRDKSAALFLVEYSAELLDWLMPRMKEFRDYALDKRLSAVQARNARFKHIRNIGHAVKDVWDGKEAPAWLSREFGSNVKRRDFFPPQPRWQLVGFSVDPNDDRVSQYAACVMHHNPVDGPVSDKVFKEAIGSVYQLVNRRVDRFPSHTPIINMVRASLLETVSIAKRKRLVSKDEGKTLKLFVREAPVKYTTGKTVVPARLIFDELDAAERFPSPSAWAVHFIESYGVTHNNDDNVTL